MKNVLLACLVVLLLGAPVSAGTLVSLKLDAQGPNDATEAGFEALVATNQVLPVAANPAYSAFGGSVSVDITAANLPDGNLDFRVVARNGVGEEKENDWIGVDTRTGNDATLTLTFSGIPTGVYSWLSTHHDGGSGANNGNLNGTADYSITDANGTAMVADGITLSSQNAADPISTLGLNFTSDGSDVVFSMTMDNGQGGDANNALFGFLNSVEITAIPEPTSLCLASFGLVSLLVRRRH